MNPKELTGQVAWYRRQRAKTLSQRWWDLSSDLSMCVCTRAHTHTQPVSQKTQNVTENMEAHASTVYSVSYAHLLEFFLLTA